MAWAKMNFAAVFRLNTDRVADPTAPGIEHITPED